MNDFNKQGFLACCVLVAIITIAHLIGVTTGKSIMVNKLCNHGEYDFCVVDTTTYKLKTDK